MSGPSATPFSLNPYGSSYGNTTTITAQSSKSSSSLKPPLSSRLKPRGILPSTLSPPSQSSITRSKTESVGPNSSVPTHGTPDSSIPRKKPTMLTQKPGSPLPKPMAASTIPTVVPMPANKSKTSPPSKHYAAFSIGSVTSKAASSLASSGSSDKSDKKSRNVIRRKGSSSNAQTTFGLGTVRTGSTTSANGSNSSVTSGSSYAGMGSRSGPSPLVLGIPLPSNMSSTSLHQQSRSNAPSVHESHSHDLPPPINVTSSTNTSSPHMHNSPGEFSTSTPSSVGSLSPGFPPPGFRKRTQSPSRPPVTRNRSGSIGQILNDLGDVRTKAEVGLHSVRESTTSTSSSSTVRAGIENDRKGPSSQKMMTPPPPPPQVSSQYLNTNNSRSNTPQAPAKTPSPIYQLGSFRSKSSNSAPTRPSRDGTMDLHAAGLGLTIPVIHSNLTTGPGMIKTRSKSTGTVGLGIKTTAQRKGSAPSATPPLPSPSFPPSGNNSRRPSVTNIQSAQNSGSPAGAFASPTIGFAYSSLPTAVPIRKRQDSDDRGSRNQSPTRASPGKAARPGLFSRGRSKTAETVEVRRGPAAGTGHEGYGHHSKASRGRSGSNTSTSGSWGRSGSQSSITSDSNFGSGSGRRSGSRESRADINDFFADKLKPVVLAGGGGVVENQNLSSPEYRPRKESASEASGVAMCRSGSEGTSNEGKRPGSRDTHQGFPNILGGKVFGLRRAATPIPAPINTKAPPFSHAKTPPLVQHIGIPKPREVKPSVVSAHNNLEKAFTPVLGQEAWTSDLYSQISPPLATDPLPTSVPANRKRWFGLQRPQPATQKPLPLSPQSSATSAGARRQVSGSQGRQGGPAHYALLDNFEQQQEAMSVKEMMLELRNKAKDGEVSGRGGYANSIRQQQHVHSVLLPEPPLPPLPPHSSASPRPTSPPAGSPSPGVNVTPSLAPLPPFQSPKLQRKNTPENDGFDGKQDARQTKPNERKRLQQVGGRLPLLGFVKRGDTTAAPKSHRTRPSESAISQPTDEKVAPRMLPPIQTQFSKRMQFGGPEGWSAPPRVGPTIESALTQQLAKNKDLPPPPTENPEPPQFQVDWDGYALVNAGSATPDVTSPFSECLDPFDTVGAQPISQSWPIRKQSIPTHSDVTIQVTNAEQDEAEPTKPIEYVEDNWSEYDDILEDQDYFGRPFSLEFELEATTLLSKRSGLKSNTSSLGSPFQFDNLALTYKAFAEAEDVVDRNSYSRESPTLPDSDSAQSESSGASQKTDSTVFDLEDDSPVVQFATIAKTASVPPKINVTNLYREKEELNQVPNTPFSMTKFLQYYSGVGIDGEDDSGVMNAIDAVYHGSGRGARSSNGSSGSSGMSRGSTYSMEMILEDEMKLRLWSLMTSTWLNFDRVLVSPAHEELKAPNNAQAGKGKAKEHSEVADSRILVVDGLGTDEWSYYCALTYPSTTVYNLSPSLSAANADPSEEDGSPACLTKPPNHKQIHHTSFDTVFPFPVGFFKAVSLRFLPSSTYPSLPFILQQCQRVLAPGGYIEISVLDADLVNMGSRTKRAVELNRSIMLREFEQAVANAIPGTVSSLTASTMATRPMSERVTRLLEKGFEDVNQCIVRLPVIGHIDGSISKGSLPGSFDATATANKGMPLKIESSDLNVTDVVSKVGRYWYTRTYERVMTGEKGESMGRSMWMDKGLLRECSKKKTGARMLVAYARKASAVPTEQRPMVRLEAPSTGLHNADGIDRQIEFPITPGMVPKPLVVKKKAALDIGRRVAFKE